MPTLPARIVKQAFLPACALFFGVALQAAPALLLPPSRSAGPPRKVVIGSAMHPFWQFPGQDQRLRELEKLIDEMARQAQQKYPGHGLDLVVLPEEIMTLGSNRTPRERALELRGPEMERMRAKAREHQTYLVAPLTLLEDRLEDRRQGTCTNSAVLIGRNGEDAGVYRKVHPVAAHDNDELEGGITPGAEFPVFQCDFGKVGIQICWDMAYADGWAELAAKGAEIVALPTASPQTARPSAYALEYGYYVVTSTPRTNASVFNPLGRISAQITDPGVLVFEIDLSYALIHWSPSLREGKAFSERYGNKAGYLYYQDEDTGLFWSNDPSIPIRNMVRDLNQVEVVDQVERIRRLQVKARARSRRLK